jgi:beta-1,4-mannosyltransferase
MQLANLERVVASTMDSSVKHSSQTQGDKKHTVVFFPSATAMIGNPYWQILKSSLEKRNFFISEDEQPVTLSLGWLVRSRKKVGVLHFHYFQGFYKSSNVFKKVIKLFLFAFNMLAARVLGFRTVLTLHNLEATEPVQPAWIDYLGHWIAVNLSERVIVHCNSARELMVRKYGRKRQIHEIAHPNFIEWYPNTISREEARKQLEIPDGAVVFSFFGAIRPNKGVELFVQAFQRLKGERFRCVIAGNGSLNEQYARSIQSMVKNDSRVSFYMKFFPAEDVQIILNSADIMVLPFARILTSGSTILSMSFARPVIAPRMGCLPTLIENNCGWLFNPGDVDSLAETMRFAAAQNYIQVGKNGYKEISQYTPENFGAQTAQVYLD